MGGGGGGELWRIMGINDLLKIINHKKEKDQKWGHVLPVTNTSPPRGYQPHPTPRLPTPPHPAVTNPTPPRGNYWPVDRYTVPQTG